MKKLIVLLAVLMVLAGAVFAEVTVSGKVDTVVMPLQVIAPKEGDPLIGAAVGRNGSTDATRARIGIVAGTENVGINFMVQFNPNLGAADRIGLDDFAEVWWKPISPLKIEAGKFVNDTLRGKIGDDNWNKYTMPMKDADGIFSRFKSTNWAGGDVSEVGFMLGITPIEPLFIGVSVPSVDQLVSATPDRTKSYPYYEKENNTWKAKQTTTGNVLTTYEKIQAGLGFTIENIGLIRAQYVGASYIFDMKTFNAGTFWQDPLKVRRIEAAFAFTGMQGLVIDLGGKIPLGFKTYEITDFEIESATDPIYTIDNSTTPTPTVKVTPGTLAETGRVLIEDDTTYQAPYQISLGAGFTADALDIKGRVDALVGGNAKTDNWEYNLGPQINVHLWPSYNLGFATAGLDVGFNFIGDSEVKSGTTTTTKGGYQFGIGAWLKKTYGASSIKGGLALSLGEVNEVKQSTVFSIPIIFDYSF
ncbi:MAG: hypothetical protein LBC51_00645 [Treponema sp.]|jgi:hypothetical protein|nr:hypothetical protein [Treponema sp.]